MLIAVGLGAIVVLTLATAFFVAQEFAYVSVDVNALRERARSGDRGAEKALRVTSQLSFMLSGAQVGITVTGLLAGYVAEPFLGRGLSDLLGGLPAGASHVLSIVLSLLIASVVQMVLGELFPKNLAIAAPDVLSIRLATPTLAYLAVTGPLIRLFDNTSNALLRKVGIEPVEELGHGATAEDLDVLINTSREQGALEMHSADMLERSLAFRERSASELMTPRPSVVTIDAHETLEAAVLQMREGFTRLPVMGDDQDDVVGIVQVADIAAVPVPQRSTVTVHDVARPALVVPETLQVIELLPLLRGGDAHLAVVVDEHGGFAGVVTMEDLAEEIVGEIVDEDDVAPEPPVHIEPGVWKVAGTLRLDEVEQLTDIELPESSAYDTLSGLVVAVSGHLPQVGDVVTVQTVRGDDVVLRVVQVENRVATQVELRTEGEEA